VNSGLAKPGLSLITDVLDSLLEAACMKGEGILGAWVLGANKGVLSAVTEVEGSVTTGFGANSDGVGASPAPCERNENAPGDWAVAVVGFSNIDVVAVVLSGVVDSVCCVPGKSGAAGVLLLRCEKIEEVLFTPFWTLGWLWLAVGVKEIGFCASVPGCFEKIDWVFPTLLG
jgi:hypothetical protein